MSYISKATRLRESAPQVELKTVPPRPQVRWNGNQVHEVCGSRLDKSPRGSTHGYCDFCRVHGFITMIPKQVASDA